MTTNTDLFAWLAARREYNVYLTRNDSLGRNNCTAKQWIEEIFPEHFTDVAADELQRMKDLNSIWQLQIYPRGEVSFYMWQGASLEYVVAEAAKQFPSEVE